jgi:Ala-tRNA(Pro) deacylase
MQSDRTDLFAYLDGLGIDATTVDHEPVFTVEESRHLHEAIEGAHTKNLFLTGKRGSLFLVVAKEDTKVDLKRLAAELGAGRFSFGKPELLAAVLGVEPGSVTPFALLHDGDGNVRVVVDAALSAYEKVSCHPLVNSATTTLRYADLLSFIRATGHEPEIKTLC